MNTAEIIDVIEKLETRLNSYWNFYSIAIIAISGWLLSLNKPSEFPIESAVILSIGFLLFIIMNASVLLPLTKRIYALEKVLIMTVAETTTLVPELKTILSKPLINNRYIGTIVMYFLLAIAMLVFIAYKAYVLNVSG
ncbi:hypothetical protein [Thalassotalea euphylliae]|uniref:Uncharacterized protein n=1 Tax=Thalassotalea euphylliae TaxID=1655234 RepID=A0A3E0U166_9GAMM|nr:hypothetical protein [Thalassotalea euphylliae]REL30337.1 hypothetical protein DXX94_06225 [Thalassotalea euphylliae]